MLEQDVNERRGFGLNDVLLIAFRHKWKLLLCALAGVLAGAGVYFLLPPAYESQAKLLVRYVVERTGLDNLDSPVKTPDGQSENILNSEVEILTSTDLALQVAEAIGPQRLMGNSGAPVSAAEAAQRLQKGLEVTAVHGSNIISVIYHNRDPELAVSVLQQLLGRYFEKHLEVHRSAGSVEAVRRETERLQAQLGQTNADLRSLRDKAGVISLAESTQSLAVEQAKLQADADSTEADLAEEHARVEAFNQMVPAQAGPSPAATPATAPPTAETVENYKVLNSRLGYLRQTLDDLLARYTPENAAVRVKQAQIDDLTRQRRALEAKYPALTAVAAAANGTGSNRDAFVDPVAARARLAALDTKAQTLKARLAALDERAKSLAEIGPRIADLERTKEVQETNLKYYSATLEKARLDETIDSSRVPNISVVQKPSPAAKATRDIKKVVLGLLLGGPAFGVAWAFLIETVLDRSVKTPLELEDRLGLPLLLSLPYANGEGRNRLLPSSEKAGYLPAANAPPDPLQAYWAALRDRLFLFFTANHIGHKPKLIGVTGLSAGVGASTLAAGLAAACSEMGSKVLLVDQSLAPKRFYEAITQYKASSFDYVIFDMPPLGDANATLPMAGFMDKMLLVVEAGKSGREAVKRAHAQLSSKVNVAVVLNKNRSSAPRWLEG